jgi:hypothetical protein
MLRFCSCVLSFALYNNPVFNPYLHVATPSFSSREISSCVSSVCARLRALLLPREPFGKRFSYKCFAREVQVNGQVFHLRIEFPLFVVDELDIYSGIACGAAGTIHLPPAEPEV